MSKLKLPIWELIAGKLHNELACDENTNLEMWRNDEKNQKLFNKVQTIHSGLEDVRRLKSFSKDHSWSVVEKNIQLKTIYFYTKQVLKYAAILVIAFLVGTYFNPIIHLNKESQYAEVQVMNGQTSHLFLFDGTEVWLNSGTIFRYPKNFNTDERNVYIDGEAFFKVAHNKKLPFKVKTNQMEVEVLGTSFNVSAYSEEQSQSVVLVEGKVQINNIDGEKIGSLEPGQIAICSIGKQLLVKQTDPYFYSSWKDGKVAFNGEKMSNIAKKLERWYGVEIVFEKESLKDYNLTGTILLDKPINQTIMALELLAPIKFKYRKRVNEKDLISIIENK